MFEREYTDGVGALYTGAIERIGGVLREADGSGDAATVPSCPDWDVADLLAHLAGTSAALLARDYPGDSVQAWVDGHVADRAGRSALDNWAEWDAVGADYAALLDKNEGAWGSLLYDAIVHEDDLRGALDLEPARDPEALAYALDRLLSNIDERARGEGIGSLRIESADQRWTIGDGAPELTLSCDDRWELLRALGARRSESRLRALTFSADPTPWIAVVPHELPTDDAVR